MNLKIVTSGRVPDVRLNASTSSWAATTLLSYKLDTGNPSRQRCLFKIKVNVNHVAVSASAATCGRNPSHVLSGLQDQELVHCNSGNVRGSDGLS